MQHEFHEFASIFPLMDELELADLTADIEKHGQREIIVMLDNKVLDGRNRYLACQRLGIKPRLRDLQCIDGNPLDFVWSANNERRHLTPMQRAVAYAQKAKFLTAGRPSTEKLSQKAEYSTKEAAKNAKVSERTMQRARLIVTKGSPEQIEAVKSGNVSNVMAICGSIEGNKAFVKPVLNATSNNGGRIPRPKEFNSLESAARAGLKLEIELGNAYHAGKKIGIADATYSKMREIVLVADRKDLRPNERKVADEALRILNEERRLTGHKYIEPIIKRIYGDRPTKALVKPIEEERVGQFTKNINIIHNICHSKIDVPQLSKTQVKESIENLEESIKGIRSLISYIREIYPHG